VAGKKGGNDERKMLDGVLHGGPLYWLIFYVNSRYFGTKSSSTVKRRCVLPGHTSSGKAG
jgi:hypothetical protein